MNSAHCSRCVCVLGWVKCREQNFTAGYTLYNYVCIKKKKKKKKVTQIFFFTKPIMVKCLNIGKNIGQPIYRSISNTNTQKKINFDFTGTVKAN